MNILFTGASSCTGMHFILELIERGHTVTCTFTGKKSDYHNIKKKRIERILPYITPIWNTSFGDHQFCTLLKKNRFESYAHHMAWTQGYGTKEYSTQDALHNNTYNLKKVLFLLKSHDCTQVILTCSVFEGLDGICSGGTTPFEAHGEAKKQTTHTFLQHSSIIPNPVGTFDRVRLVEYLHSFWIQKRIPQIHYPENIRDNIPMYLLTRRYGDFIQESSLYASPSGWVQNNKEWVQKIAKELSLRFGYDTPCDYGPQRDYDQPKKLCNIEPMRPKEKELLFWDVLAEHYRVRFP